MERIVLHIDVNSAVSWSAVKLLEDIKKILEMKLLHCCWRSKKRHGIIVAASIPAKKLGIKSAN